MSLRHRWALAAVVAAYLGSVALLPRADVPVGDDWVYARTVERLLAGDGFHILDATVVTLVAQALWGSLFAAVLGVSHVSLRLSTVALAAAGGIALYALCRSLAVDRRWSVLAAAAWLFNPLAYVLSASFMSDAPFAALLLISCVLYVRGLTGPTVLPRLVTAGSAAAAAAFLVRQQGALIPAAVAAFAVGSRLARLDRPGLALLARVAAIPALAATAYYLWLLAYHGVPDAQRQFTAELALAWQAGTIGFLARLVVVVVVYSGLAFLPVAAAASGRAREVVADLPPGARRPLALWTAIAVGGAAALAATGRLMPYVPQYLAEWGLGPADLQGGRPALLGTAARAAVTVAVVGASVLGGAAVLRRLADTTSPGRAGVGLVGAVLAGQVVGVVPPSLHFQNPVPSAVLVVTLDRYLLPVLALVLCLGAWAASGLRLRLRWAVAVTSLLAVVSVAGTRDYLVVQQAVWDTASAVHRSGVPFRHIDGGAQWDGVHLYRDGVPGPPSRPDRPWWVNLFAWELDPRYVVSSTPLPGHQRVGATTYRTWLPPTERTLLLLRRDGLSPPTSAPPASAPG